MGINLKDMLPNLLAEDAPRKMRGQALDYLNTEEESKLIDMDR
jgi:hypothetical protein